MIKSFICILYIGIHIHPYWTVNRKHWCCYVLASLERKKIPVSDIMHVLCKKLVDIGDLRRRYLFPDWCSQENMGKPEGKVSGVC